jgi:hypothetical protein
MVLSPIIHNIGASNLDNSGQGCLGGDIYATLFGPTVIEIFQLP